NQLSAFKPRNPPTLGTSVTVREVVSGRAIDLDAMAYDVTRDVIWAVEHETENVYMVDKTTGLAKFQFSATGKCLRCIGTYKDGLAFDAGDPLDPTDDALWWSYDVDWGVYKLRLDGSEIEHFDVRPISPDLASCGNSGIAVGGKLLYLGTDGCNSIVRVDKISKRSEEHTSELQSPDHLVCLLLL